MQKDFSKILKATVKIEVGNSSGTGFHFCDNKTIITNAHVIEDAIINKRSIYAKIGDERVVLTVASKVSDSVNDFAILKASTAFSNDREILKVAEDDEYEIGEEVVFAGFPHGIDDLMLQKAIIAGNVKNNTNNFYLDGSVNGGNSGGPIVRVSDFSIVGIVTARRFIAGELDNLLASVDGFKQLVIQQSRSIQITFGGVNYDVEMAKSLADIAKVFKDVVLRNANAGLGIGQKIKICLSKYKESI